MTLHFHPAASEELQEAHFWYKERSPLSAAAFASEIEVAILRIARAPLRYPTSDGTRRFQLRRFPYTVVFEISKVGIVVLAIAHHKRHPGYWRERQLHP